jgi:hypothetical protein
LLQSLHEWFEVSLTKLSRKSDTTAAIRYALGLWEALTRYCDDGRLEIDNNAAERALRVVASGRKNYLFAGSDTGGERAAAIYSLPERGLDAHRRSPREPHRRPAALEHRPGGSDLLHRCCLSTDTLGALG